MKRTPLKRKSSLKRGGRLKARSGKPRPPKRPTKYARRERDLEYMQWVKTLPCLLAGVANAGPCTGVVEADHAGLDAGLNGKAPDRTCIPLCTGHHLDRHACTGFFRGREKQWKRDWRLAAIEKTQDEWSTRPKRMERVE